MSGLEKLYIKEVKKWIILHKQEYIDECGELNYTKIAEDACAHFELYEGDNDDVPEWIFEMAAEIE